MDMTGRPDWTHGLEEHGFAIVPKVLPPKVVDRLVQELAAHPSYGLRHLVQSVPAVKEMANSSAVRTLVEPALGAEAFVARSIFFDKTPEANWKVSWHQDLTIAVEKRMEAAGFTAWSVKKGVTHVQPPVMLAARLHLDDCDATNGALQVIPGSHKTGRLDAGFIAHWRTERQPTICAVARGGALVMKPLLLHASSPAREPKHRRVVHLEFAAQPLPGGLVWALCSNQRLRGRHVYERNKSADI
jgi:ectoine hydroxylase-related dioxygenase (phytanoyl-CoA dioxygenase family)